jgi:NADH-quinone oxidoreductase subunit E
MAVRRLAEDQPERFAFTPENRAWADRQVAKFPPGRQASAVISLLWRAQEQEGWVTKAAIENVAEILDMPTIRVLEVATFYTMFHLAPVGSKAHVQVCGTTPCMLRGADDLIAMCRRRIHPEPHHRSASGDLSWEEVECLGACVNAPMVQVGADTYEDLTPDVFATLLDAFARGERPMPGPQNGRQHSMPIDGATTLTEIAYAPEDTPSGGSRTARRAPAPTVGAAPPAPPGAAEDYAVAESLRMKQAEQADAAPAAAGGADPAGREAANQEAARVDPAGRSDEAAARAPAPGAAGSPSEPKDAPAREGGPRSGEDRAAQPKSDRDSPTGGAEGR